MIEAMREQWIARLPLLLLSLLAGCATAPRDGEPVEVSEVARQNVCNSPSRETSVTLLASPEAVQAWQRDRGVELLAAGAPLPGGPFAIVELGARYEGGYGLLISRSAYLNRDTLSLNMSVLGENAAQRPQQLSSPCVLVQLPPARYRAIEVLDAAYHRRALSSEPPAPAASANPAQ